MKQLSKFVGFAAAAIALTVSAGSFSPASAQEHKMDLSGGYNYMHISGDGGDGESVPKGWYVDVSGQIKPMFSIVGQVTGNYKSESVTQSIPGLPTVNYEVNNKLYSYLFGLRVTPKVSNAKVSPFVQVLFGGARSSQKVTATGFNDSDSESNGAMELGGGVTVWASPRVGLRAGVNWGRVFEEGDSTNFVTANFGAVIPFGAR